MSDGNGHKPALAVYESPSGRIKIRYRERSTVRDRMELDMADWAARVDGKQVFKQVDLARWVLRRFCVEIEMEGKVAPFDLDAFEALEDDEGVGALVSDHILYHVLKRSIEAAVAAKKVSELSSSVPSSAETPKIPESST
jgi:hypothetical protein